MTGRLFARAFALISLAAILLLVFLLIASRAAVEDMPFADTIRCYLDRDATCLSEEITVLRREQQEARQHLEQLKAEEQAFLGGNAVHTSSDNLGGWYAEVSVVYDDPHGKTGLKGALCYAARDIVGRDQSLLLARMSEDGRSEKETIDPLLAESLGFSRADIERGLAACPWPPRPR